MHSWRCLPAHQSNSTRLSPQILPALGIHYAATWEAWDDLYKQTHEEGEFAALAVRRIISCLDLSDVAPALRRGVSAESAVCLKEILDRIELPSWEEIPDIDQLSTENDSRPLRNWRIPGTEIRIARVMEGPREG